MNKQEYHIVTTGQIVQNTLQEINDKFSRLESEQSFIIIHDLIKVVDINSLEKFHAKYDNTIIAFLMDKTISNYDKKCIISLEASTTLMTIALFNDAKERETMLKMTEYKTIFSKNEADREKEFHLFKIVKNKYKIALTIGIVGLSGGISIAVYKSILKMTTILNFVTGSLRGVSLWIQNPVNVCTINEKVRHTAIKCNLLNVFCTDTSEKVEEIQVRNNGIFCNLLEISGKSVYWASNLVDESKEGVALFISLIIFIMMFCALYLFTTKIKISTFVGEISINGL